MTDNNTSLVEAVTALTAEVARLRETIAGLQLTGAPVAAATKSKPAPVVVARAPVAAAAALVAEAKIVSAAAMESVDTEQLDQDRRYAEVEVVLAGIFMSALDDDTETAFEAFIGLQHSDRIDAPRSIPSLKEFTWKSLRKKVSKYLSNPEDPSSYEIERRVPVRLEDGDRDVKFFLHSPGRSPVPIAFKRDPRAQGSWRVTDSSL